MGYRVNFDRPRLDLESARPQAFGPYLLLEPLPPQGMFQPYVAKHLERTELCVVRQLLPDLLKDERAIGRFRREAALGTVLDHPNLLRIQSYGVSRDRPYLETEIVLGVTLAELHLALAQRGRRMPLDVFFGLARAIAAGVAFLHEAKNESGVPLKLVHRNLSSESISVSFGGEVKVGGFAAVFSELGDFKTAPGVVVGDLETMAPEQVLGSGVDARTDVYALGALFYEMLSGRSAVPELTPLEIVRFVVSGSVEPLHAVCPDVAVDLAEVIDRALCRDPDERFESVPRMMDALESALSVAPCDASALGRYVRRLLPEAEEALLETIERARQGLRSARVSAFEEGETVRIRGAGADPGAESTEPTVRIPVAGASLDREPSDVLTMPGRAVTVSSGTSRRTSRIIALVAALAVALILLTMILILPRRSGSSKAPRAGSQDAPRAVPR